MSNYNSYHSAIKISYALGLQNQILPDDFLNSIPRSTTQIWKDLNIDKFVGTEFASKVEVNIEQTQRFLDERLEKMRLAFDAFARLYLSVIELVGKKNLKEVVKNNKDTVIRLVENFPLEVNRYLVCKFLQITPHQFNIWKNNQQYLCPFSAIGYCRKRFPNQISEEELDVLKSMMTQTFFSKWKKSAIWGYAFKNGLTSMSRATWYRYCSKFGFSEPKNKEPQKTNHRKRKSIRSSKPNEIWHMDVTEFITFDNVKFYVHSVIDNFSRKALAYTISRDKLARTRIISLKEALMKVIKTNPINGDEILQLIADGGGENDNFRVRNVLRHADINVKLIIAKKDIPQSNAMIEGNFRIFKQYLKMFERIYSHEFAGITHQFFHEYNSLQPHYIHEFYTPDNIYDNPQLADIRPIKEQSNQQRINDNKNSCCRD